MNYEVKRSKQGIKTIEELQKQTKDMQEELTVSIQGDGKEPEHFDYRMYEEDHEYRMTAVFNELKADVE